MPATAYLGKVDKDTLTIGREVVDYLDSIGDEMPPYPGYPNGVMWGLGTSSEHATGYAIDFMIRNDSATGDRIAAFLWKHRVRFGLRHLIWKQRIRSTVVSPGEWRRMSDRGSVTENHYDHVHAMFNGQTVRQAFYGDGDGEIPAPVLEPQDERYWVPPVDRTVTSIQKIVGVKADGLYGNDTEEAVAAFQKAHGLIADGLWGPDTDRAYEETKKEVSHRYWLPTGDYTTKKVQEIVGVKADGLYGPSTRKAVASLQKALGVKADGLWGPKTEDAYERTRTVRNVPPFPLPRGHYFGPKDGPKESVSGFFSHREDLRRWQNKMIGRRWSFAPFGADGRYGDTTARVARSFQSEKGLKVDGLIGKKTWEAAWTEDVT